MTRGEIRTLARKRLGETTAAFWTDSELNTWINLACNDLAFRTKSLKADGFFTAPSVVENQSELGTNEFTLSGLFSDLYSIEEVYFHMEGERWIKLKPTNRTDLDILYPGWRDDVGRTIPPEEGAAITITGITQAVPAVVTAPSHGFSVDDTVIITGVVGMTEINGTEYQVRTVVDTDNVELKNTDGTDLDSSGFTAYISGGTINTIGPTTYNFDSRAGVPEFYYWDRERDLFGIWLPPDADNGTSNNVHIYYFKQHEDLGADSEVPQIPEPVQLAIVDHVVYTGFESRGWGDKANDAFGKYINKINDYITERRREREDDVLVMKGYRNVAGDDTH